MVSHNADDPDIWVYIWGSNSFSSKKAYCALKGTTDAHQIYRWIWKSSCQHKHKVFFWLLVQDRLSSRNILRRKNMHLPSYTCVLCSSNCEETVGHLFMNCEFARSCWGLLGVTIIRSPEIVQRFESLRNQLSVRFFMEIVILMCYSIWTVRNDAIFRGIPACRLHCLQIFKKSFGELLWRAKKSYFPSIQSCLEQVV